MIDILEKAAREAGEILINLQQTGFSTSQKTSHQNLVTSADIASQKSIQESITLALLKKGYKEDEIGFIGEENLDRPRTHTFVIDPIDGTTNFASRIDFFGISIAYFYKNKLSAGLIYDPIRKIIYSAIKDKGTFKNGKKLEMKYSQLEDCICATYISSYPQFREKQFPILKKIIGNVRGIRIMGSSVLHNGMLAENKINFHFEQHTYIWDLAAAKLLIAESGGIVTDLNGKIIELNLKMPNEPFPFLACHPKLLPKVLPFFKD